MALLSAYRFGLAPLRTTAELQRVLPVPVYLWVSGKVGIVYPTTTRANPSAAVGMVATSTLPSWVGASSLPLYINGRQWAKVVAPLLQDPRLPAWRGSLGNKVSSPVVIPALTDSCGVEWLDVGTQSPTIEQGLGFLYGCDWTGDDRALGKSGQYLNLLTRLVGEYAAQAGYGTPSNG